MTFIPPKTCRFCGDVYTPIPRGGSRPIPETCGKRSCRGRLMVSRKAWGDGIKAAHAAKQAKRIARIEAICLERFGPMTDRERAIFAYGERESYDRGYNAGMTRPRKSRQAAA